ncbi:hypothetical protein [Streptomyces violascens]|uniref:Uncharacterized protein n=1 Tax=Streptomyces violascens TaxID=67381 RepID=A0ABQ3QWD6_9ACTN|nr:hypothetical protein [Streptomyces violascens]GHI41589.1 hypothetical protein Sviol_59970 [Streptomyces violascens]
MGQYADSGFAGPRSPRHGPHPHLGPRPGPAVSELLVNITHAKIREAD